MRKITILFLVAVCVFFAGHADAHAFAVNWGNSWDYDHSPGYTFLGRWLVANGYYSTMAGAESFAKTGYKGYGTGDDPYFWRCCFGAVAQVVYENSAYSGRTCLGYYTGTGASKDLDELLTGTQNGPIEFAPSESFGLYIDSPYHGWTHWCTDRAENASSQTGPTTLNGGGEPQGLIYELVPGSQWLIAWEDLDATGRSDNDYNDMYVLLSAKTPEPATLALFGLGLAGCAIRRKRNRVSRK